MPVSVVSKPFQAVATHWAVILWSSLVGLFLSVFVMMIYVWWPLTVVLWKLFLCYTIWNYTPVVSYVVYAEANPLFGCEVGYMTSFWILVADWIMYELLKAYRPF